MGRGGEGVLSSSSIENVSVVLLVLQSNFFAFRVFLGTIFFPWRLPQRTAAHILA